MVQLRLFEGELVQLDMFAGGPTVEAGTDRETPFGSVINAPRWRMLTHAMQDDPWLQVQGPEDFAPIDQDRLSPEQCQMLEAVGFAKAKQRLVQHMLTLTNLSCYFLSSSTDGLSPDAVEAQIPWIMPTTSSSERNLIVSSLSSAQESLGMNDQDRAGTSRTTVKELIWRWYEFYRENYQYYDVSHGKKPREGSVITAEKMRSFCSDQNLLEHLKKNIEFALDEYIGRKNTNAPVSEPHLQDLPTELDPRASLMQLNLQAQLAINFSDKKIPPVYPQVYLPFLYVDRHGGKCKLVNYLYNDRNEQDNDPADGLSVDNFKRLRNFIDILAVAAIREKHFCRGLQTGLLQRKTSISRLAQNRLLSLSLEIDLARGLILLDPAGERNKINLAGIKFIERRFDRNIGFHDSRIDLPGNNDYEKEITALANIAEVLQKYKKYHFSANTPRAKALGHAYVLPTIRS